MLEMLQTAFIRLAESPVLGWVVAFAVVYFLGKHVALFRARKIQPNVFRWDQAIKEVVLITIGGAFTPFFLGGFTAWMADSGLVSNDPAPSVWWRVVLEFGVFALLFDTWFYWWHRLMHVEPIYTLVHRWHHVSMTPSVISTVNVNPIESLINGGFMTLYVAGAFYIGMPIHEATMPFIGAMVILTGFFIHSGFEFMPRWWNNTWATKWIITATFHDQHHQYYRYNYSGFFTIWDRICGTMRTKYEDDFANPRSRKVEERRKQERAVSPRKALLDQAFIPVWLRAMGGRESTSAPSAVNIKEGELV